MGNTASHIPFHKPTDKFSGNFLLFCIQKNTQAARYTEAMQQGKQQD